MMWKPRRVPSQKKGLTLGISSCVQTTRIPAPSYEGHMDRVVKHAIDQGLPPITAIQMATLNPAAHFGLARHLGQIAPGRFADIVLVNDLKDFKAELVIAKGMIVAEDGRCLVTRKSYPYPDWATKSVNIGRTLSARDFKIPVTSPSLKDDHSRYGKRNWRHRKPGSNSSSAHSRNDKRWRDQGRNGQRYRKSSPGRAPPG
jgi:hypothetical protein